MACHSALVALTFGACFGLSAVWAPAQETVAIGAVGLRSDGYLSRLEGFGFSGSVVVAHGDDVLLRKGYGFADREQRRPMTPATVVSIGSITKQFTGAAIMKLASSGRLRVDDPITAYFEKVPEDKREITVHQLLTHTSGLQDAFGSDFDLSATRTRLLGEILNSRLLFPPGTRHRYSNAGYSLLAMIVEESSGTSYETFLRNELFEPAGMLRTGYLLPGFEDDDLAVGYRDGERWGTVLGHPMLEDGPTWNLRGNGGIHSTPDDMYRWHRALQDGRILSVEARRRYEHPWVDEGEGDTFYGYGWVNQETDRGSRLLWHDGSNGIFSASCRRYVDDDYFVFVASSDPRFFASDLGEILDGVIFGGEYELPPAVVAIDPVVLRAMEGTYQLRPGDAITLVSRGDSLEAIPSGCWAEFLLAGGAGPLDERADELRRRTLEILKAVEGGDFTPLREALGGVREKIEAKQREYSRMQSEIGGPLQNAEIVRCLPFEGQLKVVVRMNHETGETFYRWLRWQDGEISGYGMGQSLPGGPETRLLFPFGNGRFGGFSLDHGVGPEVRIETTPEGDPTLLFGAATTPTELLAAEERVTKEVGAIARRTDATDGENALEEGRAEVAPGIEIHYSVEGCGRRWLVVPVGRLVGNLSAFHDTHRIVRYDPRGRGLSTPLAPETAVGDAVDVADLEALRQHLGIERADLLGISYYGAVVALYAASHPEYVDHVVMLGPMAPTAVEFAERAAAAGPQPTSDAQTEYERLREEGLGARDPVALCSAYQRAMMHVYFADPDAAEPNLEVCELENERPDAVTAWATALFEVIGAWDYRGAAREVQAPVLIVQGEADLVTPPAGASTWVSHLRDARVVWLSETGHLPLRERPAETTGAMREFLPVD